MLQRGQGSRAQQPPQDRGMVGNLCLGQLVQVLGILRSVPHALRQQGQALCQARGPEGAADIGLNRVYAPRVQQRNQLYAGTLFLRKPRYLQAECGAEGVSGQEVWTRRPCCTDLLQEPLGQLCESCGPGCPRCCILRPGHAEGWHRQERRKRVEATSLQAGSGNQKEGHSRRAFVERCQKPRCHGRCLVLRGGSPVRCTVHRGPVCSRGAAAKLGIDEGSEGRHRRVVEDSRVRDANAAKPLQ
mmetsp:Transcript_102363/g.320079  ORF Transcript_102363/g.320079 Transcript_102363/m.320079 type:complete len:244 (-) Transcript_102363:645-1376(-)